MMNMTVKSRIDTIQTKEKTSNRKVLDTFIKEHEDIRIDKDGNIVSKWNMNNIKDSYSTEYKLSLTKESLKRMLEMVTVIDVEKMKMNRIDIATDIRINFIENIKILDLLHKCLTVNFKGGKSWSNITEEEQKEMKTIISKDEYKRKNNEYNKKNIKTS